MGTGGSPWSWFLADLLLRPQPTQRPNQEGVHTESEHMVHSGQCVVIEWAMPRPCSWMNLATATIITDT